MFQIAPTINPWLRADEPRSWAELGVAGDLLEGGGRIAERGDFERIGLVTRLTAGDNEEHAGPTSLTA